jgi:hypothetical protein
MFSFTVLPAPAPTQIHSPLAVVLSKAIFYLGTCRRDKMKFCQRTTPGLLKAPVPYTKPDRTAQIGFFVCNGQSASREEQLNCRARNQPESLAVLTDERVEDGVASLIGVPLKFGIPHYPRAGG